MRFRDLAEKVEQLLQGGGGGGGVPDYTRRVDRSNGDSGVGAVNVAGDGTVFTATLFPTENVLVELVVDMTLTEFGSVEPVVRDPSDPTHPVHLAKTQVQGFVGDLYLPLNFIVPAGWEWSMAVEVNNPGTTEAVQIFNVHETPLS